MLTTRDQFLAFLDAQGIAHETHRHAAVFTVGESAAINAAIPGAHSKNLFLKDAKGALFLLSARDHAAIDLKALPARIGCARLSFGGAGLLAEVLGVTPGSVTAFALVNDAHHRVRFILDRALADAPLVAFHPLENTATTTLAADGFRRFLAAVAVTPLILDFGEKRNPSPSHR